MVDDESVHEALLEVKRRMVVGGLGIKPRDLRASLGLPGPVVSFVLRGERRLTREELDKVVPLVVERLERLFS